MVARMEILTWSGPQKRCTECGEMMAISDYRKCACFPAACQSGGVDVTAMSLFTGDNIWSAKDWETKVWVDG